jgi:hypothetical protein
VCVCVWEGEVQSAGEAVFEWCCCRRSRANKARREELMMRPFSNMEIEKTSNGRQNEIERLAG